MNIIITYLGHCYIPVLMPDLCTIYMYYSMYSYHDFYRTVVTTIWEADSSGFRGQINDHLMNNSHRC